MCFSATASFTAAVFLAAINFLSLKQILQHKYLQHLRYFLLASIPLHFAIQQFCEGMIWTHFDEPASATLTGYAYLYLFYALLWWPVFIPTTVYLFEKDWTRKLLIIGCLFAGFVSWWLILPFACAANVMVTSINHHLIYNIINTTPWVHNLAYVIATVVPFLVSSIRNFWIFGCAVLAALAISYLVWFEALGSVWCFLSAILSCFVLYSLHRMK